MRFWLIIGSTGISLGLYKGSYLVDWLNLFLRLNQNLWRFWSSWVDIKGLDSSVREILSNSVFYFILFN